MGLAASEVLDARSDVVGVGSSEVEKASGVGEVVSDVLVGFSDVDVVVAESVELSDVGVEATKVEELAGVEVIAASDVLKGSTGAVDEELIIADISDEDTEDDTEADTEDETEDETEAEMDDAIAELETSAGDDVIGKADEVKVTKDDGGYVEVDEKVLEVVGVGRVLVEDEETPQVPYN